MSIRPGATVPFDPSAKRFLAVDWETWLTASAEITSYEIAISPDDGTLTYDNDAIIDGEQGGTNAAVQARFLAAQTSPPTELTPGDIYTVTVHIVTNEAVPQEDDRSFFLQIKNR